MAQALQDKQAVRVAVISSKDEQYNDVWMRVLGISKNIIINDSFFTKIRAIAPDIEERTTVIGDMEERTVILVDGKLVPDRFPVEEEAKQLDGLDAVLDPDNQFFTEKKACQKALEARDRRDWLYVFECYR